MLFIINNEDIYFASGRYPTLYNNNNHFFFRPEMNGLFFLSFYREIGQKVETHNVFSSHLSGPCVCVFFSSIVVLCFVIV